MVDGGTAETIEFPRNFTVVGNIALAVWIALDALAFLMFNLAIGVIFVIIALIAVYAVLKFLGCLRPCYNCKRCTFGFGRLAALYFGGRNLKDYKYSYKLPLAVFFSLLVGAFPAVFALFSALQDFTIFRAAVFLILLALTIYSGLTWRIKKH